MIELTPPEIHQPEHILPGKEGLTSLLDEYPIAQSPDGSTFPFAYGTAGFRYDHSLLPAVFVRMGIFAVLRASFTKEQVGIMVTASHNKESDNGIKMADPDGGMLASTWEDMAVKLVNAPSTHDFLCILDSLYNQCDLESPFEHASAVKPLVHIGRDTRSHSEFLANLSLRAALVMGATVYDHGILTTPQLHYVVMHSNPLRLPNCIPYQGWERGYYETLVGSYIALLKTCQTSLHTNTDPQGRTLHVDCACGVGAAKVTNINQYLQYYRQQGHCLNLVYLVPVNQPGEGPLNHNCGAEYVQKNQCAPTIYSNINVPITPLGLASFDGDADRIVFTYQRSDGSLRLLDGDKIAVLVSCFIQQEVSALGEHISSAKSLRCGVVQTAYANGSSTYYLKVQYIYK